MSWAASGQTHSGPWTLAECIRHAQENNITLQQTELQVKQREIQLETAKGSRLPMVSGSASENLSFGRGLTADNTYSNTNTTSTGFSLGTSVPVFQGLRISNGIKENELGLKAATADLQKAREDMSVSVAQAYTQILYNMELLDVALNQVGIDSLQLVRLDALLENGKASPSQVAQQKAALGQSRLSATQARNNLNISLLDLSQLLELPDPEGFSIVRPNVPIDGILLGNPEDIYAEAIQNKPAVKAEMFRLDATEFSIKSAKGAFLPSISASGGVGTNYYTMSAAPSAVFFDQIKNNFSQYLGLSLSVPNLPGQTRDFFSRTQRNPSTKRYSRPITTLWRLLRSTVPVSTRRPAPGSLSNLSRPSTRTARPTLPNSTSQGTLGSGQSPISHVPATSISIPPNCLISTGGVRWSSEKSSLYLDIVPNIN